MRQFLFLLALLGYSVCAHASTMTATQNMSFGTWVPTASSGTISVSLSGTTSGVSGVTQAPSGTSPSQGILKYSSTGTLGAVLDVITLTPLSSSVTLSNGSGGTVTVGSFVPQTGLGVNLLNPNVNIPIGATLTFSTTPSGTYTGSVQVQGSGLLSGTATATLPISVTFWRTLTAVQQTRLNFGAIEMRGGNAVIRINAQTGVRTIVSGASGISLISSPTPEAGKFALTGQPNREISVTLPTSITLSGSGGGTMTANTFTKYPSSPTFDASGNATLQVGANLTIGTNQTSGTYTGTYQVTINY